jgi:hypothetical protein
MKVLFIVYYFPPDGGPAVQRIVKFLKYLVPLGVKPFVIAANHSSANSDISLLDEIPSSTKVIRIRDWFSWIPGELKKLFKSKYLPDKHVFWNRSAIRKAVSLIENESIDVVFTSSPPHSVQLIGLELKKKLNIKWITDFRDEWTNDPVFKHPQAQQVKKMEQEIVKNCNALITVTTKAYENFYKTNKSSFIIRNGYDAADFSGINFNQVDKGKKIKLYYAGRFTVKSSPARFFEVLENLITYNEDIRSNIEINVIGSLENKKWIKSKSNLAEYINFFPYMSHKECLYKLAEADILLLFASNTKHSEVLTGKLFEYIYTKKPILAIANIAGELSDLLRSYGNAYIGFNYEHGSIEKAIITIWNDWKNNKLSKPVNIEMVKQFDRELQAKELFNIIKTI